MTSGPFGMRRRGHPQRNGRDKPVARQTTGSDAGYRVSIALLGVVAAGIALFVLVTARMAEAQRALHEIEADPTHLSAPSAVTVALLVGVPLAVAILAFVVGSTLIMLLRLTIYLRGLHRYAAQQIARSAPLASQGITPDVLRFDASGAAVAGSERALGEVAEGTRRLLVLGGDGAGKTVALLSLARDATRKRMILAIFLGRAPLPIMLPLASFADALARHTLDAQPSGTYLAGQIALFGTQGLARRTGRLLRRGRLLLLADGLDDVREGERLDVAEALAALAGIGGGQRRFRGARLIVTCALDAYRDAPHLLAPLRDCERLALAELSPQAISKALLQARSAQARRGDDPLRELEQHRLEVSAGVPGVLASAVLVRQARGQLPFGRSALLREALDTLASRDARRDAGRDTESETTSATATLHLLSALASSFRVSGSRAVPIGAGQTMGRAALLWLGDAPPQPPTENTPARPPTQDDEEVERHCRAALRAGLLTRRLDGAELTIAQPLYEARLAARWLQDHDDSHGVLAPELLLPRWLLPVILWGSDLPRPVELARRLMALPVTEATADRAALPNARHVSAAALALAMAVLVEGAATQLAQAYAPPGTNEARTRAQLEQQLRDLLDRFQIATSAPEERLLLAEAIQRTAHEAGAEFVASVTWLAQDARINRLVRGQLVTVLGMVASPQALDALASLLGETDPAVRQAVAYSYGLAGEAALPSLLRQLAQPDDRVRARAEEVLAGIGEPARRAALALLSEDDPAQRTLAAHLLGVLKATEAVERLTLCLTDAAGAVQVAAALALGQIGTGPACVALTQRIAAGAEPSLRCALAQALGATHNPAALPALLRLLDDGESQVRTAAVAALGVLGDKRAMGALEERVGDSDRRVQTAAVTAVRRLSYG